MQSLDQGFLSDMLFVITFIAATGGAKAFFASWYTSNTSPMSRITATQRKRYTLLMFALTICFAPVALLLVWYGWKDFSRALDEWQSVFVGRLVFAGIWFCLTSPILALLTAIHIYRHPCLLAKRVKTGWVMTDTIRLGLHVVPVFKIEVVQDRQLGAYVRKFVPVGRHIVG